MKCLFCGAEVEVGKRCEYCGSMAESSYYPKEKPKKKFCIMLNCSDFDEYAVVKGDCLWNITKDTMEKLQYLFVARLQKSMGLKIQT